MRLIDADDLKKTYYRELNIEPGETGACYIAFGMLPRMIDNAKTINDEPRRGRWVVESDSEPYTEYICSACGTRASSFIGGTEMWYCLSKPNYCPNCGARMGEKNE